MSEYSIKLKDLFTYKVQQGNFTSIVDTLPNDIFDVLQQLIDEVDIDTAYGIQLDEIGEIVGEKRQGRNDTEYTLAIKTRVYLNSSNGEPEALITFIRDTTEPEAVLLIESAPAGILLSAINIQVLPFQLLNAIRKIAAAGVLVKFSYKQQGIGKSFVFKNDYGTVPSFGAGFGEMNHTPIIGGQLLESLLK